MRIINALPLLCLVLVISHLTPCYSQNEPIPPEFDGLTPLSAKDSMELANLPKLTMPSSWLESGKPALPPVVDNSENIYWRPVFAQVGMECGQASGIGLGFTYAINRERNVSGSIEENQYTPHFPWNFANGGNGWYGVSYFHSFEIAKTLGIPNVVTYGGMFSPSPYNKWMTGYDNYYQAMHNRISDVYQIDISTETGIETLKHWLHNNLEGAEDGGVANFYSNTPSASYTLPPGTPEEGKYVVISQGGTSHSMTICGYHDSICWDYNNDGQYTNDLDITGDGIVNTNDWEIGGLKFANTYSGGPSWANNGFSYMTYNSLSDPSFGGTGVWNSAVHVLYTKENCSPRLTAKITLKHTRRNQIRVRMGVSTDQSSQTPEYIIGFPVFDFQGGGQYMQGGTEIEDHKTIEFGLDLTPLLNLVGTNTPARYFLLVDEDDPSNWGTGEIVQYSIIDYTNGVNEIACAQSNVPIINNSLTKLWVDHTVIFNQVEITTDTLPPATVFEPYSVNLQATGGTEPYIWDFDLNYTETNYTETFPMVTAQQLNPGSSYVFKSLDFPFPFAGEEFDLVKVYTDGYIMFGDELSWPYQVYDFLLFTKNKYIAPFMADLVLNTSDNDGVWYEGDDNYAVFRWKASVEGYQNTSELNFAMQLSSNGDIKFYYGNINEYPEIEWISGVSAGDNKYYQFTEVSNDVSIPQNYVCDLKSSNYPEGFSVSRYGEFTGIPVQIYDNYEIKFRVRDEDNIENSKVVYFSTDGANYLIIDDFTVVAGDNDIIEFGETVLLSVDIKSLGDVAISGANMVISSEDEFITLTDSTELLGDFEPGEVKTFTGAFTFDVSILVPDEHEIDLHTLITDDSGEDWESHIYLTAFSPELMLGGVTLEDGNNGALDPGETADLIVNILNTGGASANNVVATLSTTDSLVTIENNTGNISSINQYSSGEATFTITADENTPIGYTIEFSVDITADLGVEASGTFSIMAGQLPVVIIDLDPNTSSGPVIEGVIQNFDIGVDYMTDFPANLNYYSTIFVCLGIYSSNYVLPVNEGQLLADFLNNGGSLYMEGGDTWYYDQSTPVHPMFNIDPEADGTSDLGTVLGQDSTFTEDMSFNYLGENSWIDHISAISPAFLIFENDNPVYGACVAYDAGTYKTIGASFEFGGLADGNSPSTKEELMTEYLDFFGIYSGDIAAGFVADETEICSNDTVHYTDNSTGNIISWNWVFEGGDPETSELQNPSVT